MKKNNSNHSESKLERERKRNLVLLILALLFFLWGLAALAKASKFDLLKTLGLRPSSRTGTTTTIRTTGSGTQGSAGSGGGSGSNGSGGGSGSNGGGGTGSFNVNIKTDTGAEINAGIDDQGRLYVNPTVAPNAQGGTGVEGSVNGNKVIDTSP